MSLEVVYWIAMGLGLGMLFLSLVAGDLLELDLDIGGSDVPIAPILFAFVAAFGIGGIVGGQALMLGSIGSVFSGVGVGLVAGVLTALGFAALRKAESKARFSLEDLIGLRGRASLALGPGKVGKVTVNYEGMTRALAATATEDIQPGEEVVVSEVVGSALEVRRPESLGL